MGKEIIAFGEIIDIDLEKHKFHHRKNLFKDVDIKKIQVSNRVSSGEKNHILLVTEMMIIKLNLYA